MACGCTKNNNIDIKKKLSLKDMEKLSTDQIVSLYKQGYALQDNFGEESTDTFEDSIAPISPYLLPSVYGFMSDTSNSRISQISQIESMQTYSQVCTGTPTSDIVRPKTQDGGTIIHRGRAGAVRIIPTSRCIDAILFDGVKRYADLDVHFEIREDSGGMPKGTPGSPIGRLADIIVPFSDIPTTFGFLSVTFQTVLPSENTPFWIVAYSSDFVCDPSLLGVGNERIEFSFSTTINTNSDRVDYNSIPPEACTWHPLQYSWAFETFKLTYIPVSTTGSLRFITDPPQADIYFGTVLQGTTDSSGILIIGNLSPGQISYTVKKSGYVDKSDNTTVVSGITTDVSITLSPTYPSSGSAIGLIALYAVVGGIAYYAITRKKTANK